MEGTEGLSEGELDELVEAMGLPITEEKREKVKTLFLKAIAARLKARLELDTPPTPDTSSRFGDRYDNYFRGSNI